MKTIWLIPGATLGVSYMYNSLVLLKACGKICFLYAATRLRYLKKKTYYNRICRFIPESIKCQENLLRTRLALVLYVLVQKASLLRYKILAVRNRAALSCANTKGAP